MFSAAGLPWVGGACKTDRRTERLKPEEEGQKAAEQSRSQAAEKDHLGARSVSFVSSPL